MLENGELLDAKTLINLEGLENKLTSFCKKYEDGKLILSPVNKEDFNSTIINRSMDFDNAVEALSAKYLSQIILKTMNKIPFNQSTHK